MQKALSKHLKRKYSKLILCGECGMPSENICVSLRGGDKGVGCMAAHKIQRLASHVSQPQK
jgi:hypothetical protein